MVKFFKERGISQKTLIDCRITEEKFYQPRLGKEVNNIVFNYFYGVTLLNKKFRSSTKDFAQCKNAKKVFYGINDIEGEKECYIAGARTAIRSDDDTPPPMPLTSYITWAALRGREASSLADESLACARRLVQFAQKFRLVGVVHHGALADRFGGLAGAGKAGRAVVFPEDLFRGGVRLQHLTDDVAMSDDHAR